MAGKYKERLTKEMDAASIERKMKQLEYAELQGTNRYSAIHTGPFIVHAINLDVNEDLGRQRLTKIDYLIAETANKVTMNNKIRDMLEWRVFIPNFALHKTGLVKNICPDASLEDIKFNFNLLNPSHKVEYVERLEQWDKENEVRIPTNTLKVTFIGNSLPTRINLFFVKLTVKPFIERIKKCINCQRFGHNAFQCKGHMRCKNCCGDHHVDSCSNPLFCGNCNGHGLFLPYLFV